MKGKPEINGALIILAIVAMVLSPGRTGEGGEIRGSMTDDNAGPAPAGTNSVLQGTGPGEAESAFSLGGLGLSGFFDLRAERLRERENIFGMGPFEFDIESSINDHVSGSAALVFEDGAAEVGVGFVDLHFFPQSRGPSSPRGRIFTDPSYHIQIGQFDVPFGIDYLFYATPDRLTISAPLATDLIFDGGWTDLGVRTFFASPYCNASVFIVNGFDSGYTFGGRAGVRPLENPFATRSINREPVFELGLSCAYDLDINSARENIIFGVDSEIHPGNLAILYEWILRRQYVAGIAQHSFSAQIGYALPSLSATPFVRGEEYHEKNIPEAVDSLTRRYSVGFMRTFTENVLLKIEINAFDGDLRELALHRKKICMQLAVMF